VSPGSGGRTTALLDVVNLFDRTSNTRRPGTWLVKSGRRPFLCDAVWGRPPKDFGIRYDPMCLFPSSPRARMENQLILKFISESESTKIEWVEKQLLIINNQRMLHGRGESRFDDQDRCLKRVLVG
jgi:Taurine catabolism dioxygenase TauD, TfdA family